MADPPKIVQIAASSTTVKEEPVTTVVALLEDGTVVYTGISPNPEWHRLPPVSVPEEELD